MTERVVGRKFVEEILGGRKWDNFSSRAAATLDHVVGHLNLDNELLAGIEKNLRKLISEDDLKKVRDAHAKLPKHLL
jgi:hypothetical protein